MYQVDLPFEQLIKSYTNKNDRLCYLDRKNQIIELEKEIDRLKNTIKTEKSKLCEQLQENEITKLEKSTNSKEMNITNIANYLGVSRQTIYNLKKKHSSEKQ